jgi:hypothetical protein
LIHCGPRVSKQFSADPPDHPRSFSALNAGTHGLDPLAEVDIVSSNEQSTYPHNQRMIVADYDKIFYSRVESWIEV